MSGRSWIPVPLDDAVAEDPRGVWEAARAQLRGMRGVHPHGPREELRDLLAVAHVATAVASSDAQGITAYLRRDAALTAGVALMRVEELVADGSLVIHWQGQA